MPINRWMDEEDVVYIYNGILLSHKKEWMPFAATWMDLEIIILSKSDRERQISWYYLYVESKVWCKWTYLLNRNRLTDIENKLMFTKEER